MTSITMDSWLYVFTVPGINFLLWAWLLVSPKIYHHYCNFEDILLDQSLWWLRGFRYLGRITDTFFFLLEVCITSSDTMRRLPGQFQLDFSKAWVWSVWCHQQQGHTLSNTRHLQRWCLRVRTCGIQSPKQWWHRSTKSPAYTTSHPPNSHLWKHLPSGLVITISAPWGWVEV